MLVGDLIDIPHREFPRLRVAITGIPVVFHDDEHSPFLDYFRSPAHFLGDFFCFLLCQRKIIDFFEHKNFFYLLKSQYREIFLKSQVERVAIFAFFLFLVILEGNVVLFFLASLCPMKLKIFLLNAS